jgi:hypothetical protein
MKLNLFELSEEKLNVGSIRVVFNKSLRQQVINVIDNLRKDYTLQKISKKLNIDYTTLWDYCNRSTSIPLVILKGISSYSNISFSLENALFTCGHQNIKVKLPLKLDETLAKIIGAILADGHIKIRESARGHHYELVLREGHRTNIEAFIKWFMQSFNVKLNLKKQDNHYFIYCSNKIIVLYLVNALKLLSGRKVDIVYVPKYFMKSNRKIKISLLQGIFMFDGAVDYATGYVSLVSKSRVMAENVNELLNQIGLSPDYFGDKLDKYGRSKIIFRKKVKLKKCISLFEENTEKWFRLYEHFFGLKNKVKNKAKMYELLNYYYPKVRPNSLTFSEVVKTVNKLNDNANVINISKRLKKRSTTVYAYLAKLTYWKILKSKKVGLKKYWELNEYYIPQR